MYYQENFRYCVSFVSNRKTNKALGDKKFLNRVFGVAESIAQLKCLVWKLFLHRDVKYEKLFTTKLNFSAEYRWEKCLH